MVIDPHGPPCPCGKKGCWERFASGSALGRLGREAAQAGQLSTVVGLAGGDPEAVRGEHVTTAALDGDPEAIEVMGTFAWWLALGPSEPGQRLGPLRHHPRWRINRRPSEHLSAPSGLRSRIWPRHPGPEKWKYCPLTSASAPALSALVCLPFNAPAADKPAPARPRGPLAFKEHRQDARSRRQ